MSGDSAAFEVVRERFALATARERWPDFVSFEHAVLPAPLDFHREGDDLVVVRQAPPRRRIRDGRVPVRHAPALFLQAAALLAALQAAGSWADEDDLAGAGWDLAGGVARLWLAGTPAGIAKGGLPAAASDVLASFLARVARRSSLASPLAALIAGADARRRRADFWVGAAFRLYPPDGALEKSAAAASIRLRTVGAIGMAARPPAERARIEKARAILAGRPCSVFAPDEVCWSPGQAIGMPGATLRDATARLRALPEPDRTSVRPLWICASWDRWDAVSRSAVAAAAVVREGSGRGNGDGAGPCGAEIREVPDSVRPPASPDEWRRELLVPCGTVRATLRFCERLSELAAREPVDARSARAVGLAIVAHPAWPEFVADPTGDAPLPPVADDLTSADGRQTRRPRRRGQSAPASVSDGGSPEAAVAAALVRGAPGTALAIARRWRESAPGSPPELWFELAARLAAACPAPRPAWLELLEAEREIAGGRTEEARACLRRAAAAPGSGPEQTSEGRAASLRLSEITADAGRWDEAAASAAVWLQTHAGAPAGERIRALRIGAASASRSGDEVRSRAHLDEAERIAAEADLPARDRLDLLLARAAVLSRAGRFEEEAGVYAEARTLLARLALPDEILGARLLAAEALGLSDRREFEAAVARLEEARSILRDDPVESARVAIDLAAALYHAGRRERCGALLEEAAALAAAAGREDLARIALANRVEAAIASEDWSAAKAGIDSLSASARRDGDPTWTLVALHGSGRLALRRGLLDDAVRDNAEAIALASRLGDRLEIGELRLEAGDLAALRGDVEEARRSWRDAARDPPNRSDRDARARERLAELEILEAGPADEPGERMADLTRAVAERILRGEYAAAESVARWSALFPGRVSDSLRGAAADLLRRRGGSPLADIVAPAASQGPAAGGAASSALRGLRDAVAETLAGGEPPGRLPLGLATLSLTRAETGEEIRIGGEGLGEPAERALRAGSDLWTLRLWPSDAESDADEIALVLETLLFRTAIAAPSASGFAEGWRRFGVVTADPSMDEPYRRLRRFAPKAMTVLVLGESGSGKEAVARAVHALSPRAAGPFVAVNVSAIPAALVESELFGHARGAFTGADRDRAGLLEEAGRGTMFFDEIGDLAPALQSKLLRALQDREIRRVGENRPRRIDVRIVSATSRDLGREVEAGRFREDLYYRIHVAVVRLPRLAERGRDALLLARHFLEAAAREDGRGAFELAPDAAAAILAHSWPGNVRELQSAIVSAAALADGRRIDAALLPEVVRRAVRPAGRDVGYRSSVDAHRRDLIMEALERAGGNRSRAARDLRLSRQALLYLIRELRVPERRVR